MMNHITTITEAMATYPWRRLAAGHVREHGPPAIVATRQKSDGQKDADCAEALLKELQHHCDASGGYQRYEVVFTDGDSTNILGTLLLNLAGHDAGIGGGALTVHGGGGVSQAMYMEARDDPEAMRLLSRHAERSFVHAEKAWDILGRAYRGMMGSMGSEIERLRQRCDQLDERDRERRELGEQLREQHHRRQLETSAQERRLAMREHMVSRLAEVAPYAIAALTGAAPVAELAESMSEEQFDFIMKMATPKQRELFMDLAKKGGRGALAADILAGRRPPLGLGSDKSAEPSVAPSPPSGTPSKPAPTPEAA